LRNFLHTQPPNTEIQFRAPALASLLALVPDQQLAFIWVGPSTIFYSYHAARHLSSLYFYPFTLLSFLYFHSSLSSLFGSQGRFLLSHLSSDPRGGDPGEHVGMSVLLKSCCPEKLINIFFIITYKYNLDNFSSSKTFLSLSSSKTFLTFSFRSSFLSFLHKLYQQFFCSVLHLHNFFSNFTCYTFFLEKLIIHFVSIKVMYVSLLHNYI